jgi:hypothetical protein
MERLANHYMALGIEVLFKRHPRLEDYLRASYDDGLVAKVRPPLYILYVTQPQYTNATPTHPDLIHRS